MALAVLLLAAACGQPTAPAPAPPAPGEWRAFEGSWSATGTRHILNLGPESRSAIFDLTGSLLLAGERKMGVGFQARAIGFSDGRTGMQGRSVWTDEHGDQVISELKGEAVGTGNRITGTFVGGTGRYAGVTGEYSFQWQYVVESEDGTVSGRAIGFKGRAKLGQAPGAPAAGKPQ